MPQRTRNTENPEPNLFDAPALPATLPTAQLGELAELVAQLLREIAVALANGEAGDEQDRG